MAPDVSRLTWLGHSTVLIDLDGVRILTDPLLRVRVAHLTRIAAPVSMPLDRLDAVLVSHLHWDHLDLRSLDLLGRDVPLVVPRGAGRLLRRRGFASVAEVSVGDELAVGGLQVRATPATHGGRRIRTAAPALGFVVSGSESVYFAGDTDLFPEMSSLAPALDVALIPVWGWGPTIGSGHLGPGTAAEALRLLQPRFAVPVHWGTYAPVYHRSGAFLTEPAVQFAAAAAELAPATDVRILPVGASLDVAPRSSPTPQDPEVAPC